MQDESIVDIINLICIILADLDSRRCSTELSVYCMQSQGVHVTRSGALAPFS
jgi:hypothetical protein